MTTVSLIVAYSRNRVIGKDNQLPWRLPSDLAHFKRQTLGKPIIMGRKTWLSLGRPLPGRTNIVVSRSGSGDFTGAVLVSSLAAALEAAGQVPEVCIIGGAQLYREALPQVDSIVATEIDADVSGDAFFPELAANQWVETNRQSQPPENGLAYDFVHYQRRTKTDHA
jgi:dihydrofolate reductase